MRRWPLKDERLVYSSVGRDSNKWGGYHVLSQALKLLAGFIQLQWPSLVNKVMKFRVLYSSQNCIYNLIDCLFLRKESVP
jgi:hypothetical protein